MADCRRERSQKQFSNSTGSTKITNSACWVGAAGFELEEVNIMSVLDRRSFLRAGAALGLTCSGGLPGALAAAAAPSLSIVKYNSSPADPDGIAEEAERLTRRAVEALGNMSRFVSRGEVVWVKPNIAWDRRPEQAANTNPDVVATLVKLCYEAGAKQVIVSDNPTNDGRRTFARSGIQAAAEKAGARVFFLDPRKFRRMAINGKVLREWEVYTDVVEADKLINVPIVKHHGYSLVTLGMKNLMGVIGGQRSRYHQDLTNTIPDLAAFVKSHLIVLDAIRVLTANGPTGGSLADVERRDTVVAGTDQVAVDAFGATLLGHRPEAIAHIKEAASRGMGNMDYDALNPVQLAI
jgi:uncharacterized protein (DUF362 family)